jgi:hypothetical protein
MNVRCPVKAREKDSAMGGKDRTAQRGRFLGTESEECFRGPTGPIEESGSIEHCDLTSLFKSGGRVFEGRMSGRNVRRRFLKVRI